MTVTLELSPDEEAMLKAKAGSAGLGEADFLKKLIVEGKPQPQVPELSPAELLEYWRREGLIGPFGGDLDSPELARELRRQASTRNWD